MPPNQEGVQAVEIHYFVFGVARAVQNIRERDMKNMAFLKGKVPVNDLLSSEKLWNVSWIKTSHRNFVFRISSDLFP